MANPTRVSRRGHVMRRLRAMLAGMVVALMVGLLPLGVAAQDEEISFPPDSGSWEGFVDFSGHVSSDTKGDDGSFGAKVTDVIDDTDITLAFVVGEDGQITSGTMAVELVWFTESAGTSPVNFNTYHIKSFDRQTGTLKIKGNADRLVAKGKLTHTTDIDSSRHGQIEEVSGTEKRKVEWTFHITEIDCAQASGEIHWATGRSLMNSAFQPKEKKDGGTTSHNALDVRLVAWPDPLLSDNEAVAELAWVEQRIRTTDYPDAQDLLDLVKAWNDLHDEYDKGELCMAPGMLGLEMSWLTSVIQEAFGKAFDKADYYKALELSDLWHAGLKLEVLDEALMGRFLDVFDHKLDQVIAIDDADEISDIRNVALFFVERLGHTNLGTKAGDLRDKASEALNGGSG
jgi:hypothetical protein